MKNIGSVKEDLNIEKRISITPEITKKFVSQGFIINLEKNYAQHLGIDDKLYKENGANFFESKKDLYEKSEIILKVGSLSTNETNTIFPTESGVK